ncbi:hypothetical protein [Pseudonocardia alaniniphila]|uniref:Uncharacterized protein n=1 Tax=Pseudonocardia alaniniphila TaxID=75291 RepID=A0ABS9TM26_9PSEU|nr:hypothetical protein [Pseudonocardia alaniniphila]MCH6169591.1 hypothetical protein [Pseudonocardia alaniniphila]
MDAAREQPSDSRKDPVDELREAAETLRGFVPQFRDGRPVSEFVPLAIGKLIDAVADSIARGDDVRDAISGSALEIARHLHYFPSGPSEPSGKP